MDAFIWTKEATEKLEEEFGDRLVFVGLQGSRARNEARDDSDIDLVVLLDHVNADDLDRYRMIIETLPYHQLACGFVGSERALASWPRHELFQFYHDTKPIRGKLPGIEPFAKSDALQAARIGASTIYHAACHAYTFDEDATDGILESLFKSAFFALQALQFARTGEYPRTKAALAKYLEGDEARILEIGRNWKEYCPTSDDDRQKLMDLLLGWSEKTLCQDPEETQAIEKAGREDLERW